MAAASSLLCVAGPAAREPRAWAERWARLGLKSVRIDPAPAAYAPPDARPGRSGSALDPGPGALSEEGMARWLKFYAAALGRLLELGSRGSPLREEWAGDLWRRVLGGGRVAERAVPGGLVGAEAGGGPWDLPGIDLVSELAYSPGGEVYSSETAAAGGLRGFHLGRVGTLRYEDLPDLGLVRELLKSLQPGLQPLCSQCAYAPYCSLPAAGNFVAQGDLWGRTPTNPWCAHRMGILDLLFIASRDKRRRKVLDRWATSIP